MSLACRMKKTTSFRHWKNCLSGVMKFGLIGSGSLALTKAGNPRLPISPDALCSKEDAMSETPGSQLTAFNKHLPVFDRHGNPICIGDSIRVKRCVGRYGETITEEGIVVPQTDDNPEHADYGNFRYRNNKGKIECAGVRFDYQTQQAVCYTKHNDFEHGHERWVEVL